MARRYVPCARVLLIATVLFGWIENWKSEAGDYPWRRRPAKTVVVTYARPVSAPGAPLGTFQPTPYVMVRGNNPLGGGYSPLGISGDQTMSLYGPFSLLRARSAPVLSYVRGYDGQLRVLEGTSFSNPNLPELSPVIYPTEANNFYGPRVSRTPPWWSSAINWIDQH
jgi:hypothetical protein